MFIGGTFFSRLGEGGSTKWADFARRAVLVVRMRAPQGGTGTWQAWVYE